MLNFPRELNVCGRVYTVKEEQDLRGDGNQSLWGEFRDDTGEIVLGTHHNGRVSTPTEMTHTFFHELCHAILDEACPALTAMLPDGSKEDWIDSFASLWSDTVVRNGLFVLPEEDAR